MQSRNSPKPCFTVRKVTDNHWGLVYMGCPARSANGQVHRFPSEKDAQDMARNLNISERRRTSF